MSARAGAPRPGVSGQPRLTAEYVAARALLDATTLDEAIPKILRSICEALDWELWVDKIGQSSLTLAVEAKAGGETRVRATLVVVHASLDTRRPMPFAQEMRDKLARFAR